jgi:hypothetical protein
MTVQTWLEWAVDDARRRSLDDAVPVLEALAKAAAALREAERAGIDAPGDTPSEPGNDDA